MIRPGREISSEPGYSQWRGRLLDKAAAGRIPIEGTLELTPRCNLDCPFCYLPRSRPAADLPFDRIDAILGELSRAGCLWLGLTGGEPLLRDDFLRIHERALELGFLVTIMTNGTLLTARLADRLAAAPPLAVEITLLGGTAATHDALTGVPGSFARCLSGVDALLERKVRVRLKATIVERNVGELAEMRRIARNRGEQLRFDPLVHSRLDGAPLPTGTALEARRAAELLLADPAVRQKWLELEPRRRRAARESPGPFSCSAGLSAFHVTSQGLLTPCVMLLEPSWDLGRGSFADGWNGPIRRAVSAAWRSESPCRGCELAGWCESCPGWGTVEAGDPEARVQRLCELAAARREVLSSASREVG
jgi:radical SAM protein with 4Fe4S-binding SPASM domain